MNVLFIVIDQLRADCLFGALAEHVPTPHLDRLAAEATVFLDHHTVTCPCGPARASLLTGRYPKHHGALRNGTPLHPGQTNIALEVRKRGYEPLLFGYTDTQPHPLEHDPNDPDLAIYEGVMPGFREIVEMRQEHGFEWPAFLRAKGYALDLPLDRDALYAPQGGKLGGPALYAAQDSDTAYLTDETIKHLDIRRGGAPWFAHVTYIRPHPPLVAPAPYHALIDPATLPEPLPRSGAPAHPFVDAWFSRPSDFSLFHGFNGDHGALDSATTALLRATYLGLIAEVDHHLGRLMAWLDESGQRDDTLLIVTADHGEMLGDYGMWGKASVFPPAYHIPLLIRPPGDATARRITAPSESIDIAPTILDCLGAPIPASFDGHSLRPWLQGETPLNWRKTTHLSIALGDTGPSAEITADHQHWSVDFAGRLPPLTLPRSAPPHSSPIANRSVRATCRPGLDGRRAG